ncbi:hypothetical protein AAFF_G00241680 [Aldrovandia affinis]|uniref:NF-kappa-B inhibitor alpha n=1 Tax=Aldrovandia affinis TaxID=143900 RepID=A0AAD7SVX6_9TELE|nr:hypothetical protein AAFF_G00241680 [Aldrovandia affinis]
MDVHRVYNSNQMDYDIDHANPKLEKMLPCNEDRLDSGLDSLKEDEYNIIVKEMESMNMAAAGPTRSDSNNEPWKQEVTEDGDTFLHLAIIHEATEQVIQMISLSRNDPFLNIQNNQRQTALHLAVIMDQPQVVDKLLRANADPQLVDDSGNTPLHIACKKGSLSCFSVLTQVFPSHLPSILTTPNYSGHNCLHLASIHGFLSLVENLLKLGADVDAPEQCNGRTALHLAVDLQNPALSSEIRQQLYTLTAQELRVLPESESEESDGDALSEDDEMYDDIQLVGHK